VTPNSAVARVPEKIGRGAMATGFLVYNGPQEFVIDFIQGVARPAQLVARVVLTPQVMEQFIIALRDNVAKFASNFGPPPTMPRNPGERALTPQEIYENLKIPEELQSGAYANSVAIRHTPAEFHLDFITNFYPHGSVSARLYLAAPRITGLLDTLQGSLTNFQRARGMHLPHPPGPGGTGGSWGPGGPGGMSSGGPGPIGGPGNGGGGGGPDAPPPAPRAYPY
jgi:hypothetical protein